MRADPGFHTSVGDLRFHVVNAGNIRQEQAAPPAALNDHSILGAGLAGPLRQSGSGGYNTLTSIARSDSSSGPIAGKRGSRVARRWHC